MKAIKFFYIFKLLQIFAEHVKMKEVYDKILLRVWVYLEFFRSRSTQFFKNRISKNYKISVHSTFNG